MNFYFIKYNKIVKFIFILDYKLKKKLVRDFWICIKENIEYERYMLFEDNGIFIFLVYICIFIG